MDVDASGVPGPRSLPPGTGGPAAMTGTGEVCLCAGSA
jgi:hypothetical protein